MTRRVLCALLFWLLVPIAQGQTATEAIRKIRPSVVQIRWQLWNLTDEAKKRWKEKREKDASQMEEGAAGTGFIVNTDGYIITALHVINDALILFKQFPAAEQNMLVAMPTSPPGRDDGVFTWQSRGFELVETDREHDLALLKVRDLEGWMGTRFQGRDFVLRPEAVHIASRVSEGEQIAVSGYPFASELPQLMTNVGWLATDLMRPDVLIPGKPGTYRDYLYLGDVRVNPGNSGGPVYRVRDGAVLGVVISNLLGHTNLAGIVPMRPVTALLEKNGVSWLRVLDEN